jgi:hypothetical protein
MTFLETTDQYRSASSIRMHGILCERFWIRNEFHKQLPRPGMGQFHK